MGSWQYREERCDELIGETEMRGSLLGSWEHLKPIPILMYLQEHSQMQDLNLGIQMNQMGLS